MTAVIYKYPIPFAPGGRKIPIGPEDKVVHVGLDPASNGTDVAVWVAHHNMPVSSLEEHGVRVVIVGTGHLFDEPATVLGSVNQGPYMWHVVREGSDA